MIQDAANERRVAFWTFCAFFTFYLLGLGGHIYTPDGNIMFNVTRSLVSEGKLDIPELRDWLGFGGAERIDPQTGERKFYAKYGVGLSLSAIPAYFLGKKFLPFVTDREKDIFANFHFMKMVSDPITGKTSAVPVSSIWYESGKGNFTEAFEAYSVTWTMPFLVAGIVAALFLICTELGFSRTASFLLAAAAGVASPLWHYSKEFFSEPLSGFGLTWFLYFAVSGSKKSEPGARWLLCGCALGVLLMAKVANAVILVPCLLLAFVYSSRYNLPARAWSMLAVFSGVAAGASVVLLYNYLRFGTVWATGYGDEVGQWTTPFWEGVAGLLFSPGRGALLYCPLLFLALAGLHPFARRFPREAVFIGIVFVCHILLYAKWHVWEGGWCWGPRFLMPVLPISLLPAVTIIENVPAGRGFRLATICILIVSMAVAVSGVIVSYNDYYKWLHSEILAGLPRTAESGSANNLELMRWSWKCSPLCAYWSFPVKDYFLLPRAIANPGSILAAMGGILLVFIGSCWMLLRELSAAYPMGGKVNT